MMLSQPIGNLLPSAVGVALSPIIPTARSPVNPKNLALILTTAGSIAQAGLSVCASAVVVGAKLLGNGLAVRADVPAMGDG
jgi:hypothetical protein